ncbi:nickel/cobalt transporter [Entomohabitans teleogrylli]|uniref:nickel/cobalt transporter n=1 Tax=Entomohabitans teleogrylli TaxID=1384589 RepID=UPI00073D989B|nr:nickel/cobalt transporter [Entomohabitans teleogrylli]
MTANVMHRYKAFSIGLGLLASAILVVIVASRYWSDFIQWCLEQQIVLHRYLVLYLLQLNDHQYSGGAWLLTGAFFYGVLHAIGPGHGKFIVTSWLSTHQESATVARVVPFLGSLMQGVSAIAFVWVLAVGFNLAAGDLSQSRWYVEKASAVLIGLFGAFLLWRACREFLPRPRLFRALRPLHQHGPDCGCGHQHGVGYNGGNWKTHVGVILAVGARPCSGAIMILLFSNALGIVTWGMAAVLLMAFGTALSIAGLSLAVGHMRNTVSRIWLTPSPRALRITLFAVRACGALLLMLFALVLFLTVVPVSANGDYIAAGC